MHDALENAQQVVLRPERWRSINPQAIQIVREYGEQLPALPEPAAVAPPPQDLAPPPPEEAEPAAQTTLRECMIDLLVETARLVLADPEVQEIALAIGNRFLTEALQPPRRSTTPHAQPHEEEHPPTTSGPAKVKRPVVIVGPDSKQVGLIEQEFGKLLHLTFFDSNDSRDAIRSATKNAFYAISTLPRPNGPIDMILRTNVIEPDNYKHISGIHHLKTFLAQVANGMRTVQ